MNLAHHPGNFKLFVGFDGRARIYRPGLGWRFASPVERILGQRPSFRLEGFRDE